jgi:hypothetical protein
MTQKAEAGSRPNVGWTLVVNPDGTTSAWNKNKTKVLHSHRPPARAG